MTGTIPVYSESLTATIRHAAQKQLEEFATETAEEV